MPLSRYDRYFGGKKDAAEKALERMTSPTKGYGSEKGKRVFYALINKRKQGGKS